MKKLIRYSTFAFMAAVALLTASCTEEYEYDQPEAVKDNSKVTLAAESQSYTFSSDDATQTIEFTVNRAKTDAAETVKLYSDNDKLSVPSEVSFAAGESSKTVQGTSSISQGETILAIVSVDEESANLYGDYKLDFTIFRDYNYTSLGTGIVSSNFFGAAWYNEIKKADGASWYRVVEPYYTGYDLVLKVDESDSSVTVEKQACYVHSRYGTVYAEGSGKFANNTFAVNLKFTCAAGSFGTYTEYFALPE